MGESLTEQRRVSDDGLRVVKLCDPGRKGRVRRTNYIDGTGKASHG